MGLKKRDLSQRKLAQLAARERASVLRGTECRQENAQPGRRGRAQPERLGNDTAERGNPYKKRGRTSLGVKKEGRGVSKEGNQDRLTGGAGVQGKKKATKVRPRTSKKFKISRS